MILAHVSELHLGFRAYERAERGRNIREQDIARAFDRVIAELIERAPNVVVCVGDIFDRADPSPAAILSFTRGVHAFREALPDSPVVLVAGARDTPLLPGDAGVLAVLEMLPGVYTASGAVRELNFPDLELHMTLVPYRAGVREPFPAVRPDADARWNVAVAFGDVASEGVRFVKEEWDYVALGGRHRYERVGTAAAYAGSLERIGSRPWLEAGEEKGFISVDLPSRRVSFHPVQVRPVVAMAPIRMPAGGRSALPDRMKEVTDEIPGGIDRKIVHMEVQDAEPRDLLSLRGELLVGLRRRALHLEVTTDGGGLAFPDRDHLGDHRFESADLSWGRLPPSIEGDDPILGTIAVSLPAGLIAVVSMEPGATRRLLDLPGSIDGMAPWVSADHGSLVDEFALIEQALSPRVVGHAGTNDLAVQRVTPTSTNREVLVRRLNHLRADHAEIAGDVEVATMEWLRERQDAETNLRAHRDRARELKSRLSEVEDGGADAGCPTCARPLEGEHAEVVNRLRDEWEAIVMDGSWWRRRREQLEYKPVELRELEGRALQLLAAVESSSEELEVIRRGVNEDVESRDAPSSSVGVESVVEVEEEAAGGSEIGVRTTLIEAASGLLQRITAARALALVETTSTMVVVGPARDVVLDGEAEVAAAVVSLRLAGALLAGDLLGRPVDVVVPEGLVEALRDDDRLRLLDSLTALERRLHRAVVALRPESAERRPEVFRHVLEVRAPVQGTPPRWLQTGVGRIDYS